MQYIIFGAGATGEKALSILGLNRVKCFADNSMRRKVFHDKPVISFKEMLAEAADSIIVIAAEKYYVNMEIQLKMHGVKRYFVFHENHGQILGDVLPGYWLYGNWERVSYTRMLLHKQISGYQSIAIYGTNALLPYLISELAIQSGFESIKQIITEEEYDREEYLGIPCVKLSEMRRDIDCVLINKRRDTVKDENIWNVNTAIMDLYDIDEIEPAFIYPKLVKYKDIHKGKRIFVIGNGPSLTIEDLNKLAEHKEICIGFNMVYRAFKKTKWKPDYLGMADRKILFDFTKDAGTVSVPVIMADEYKKDLKISYCKNMDYIHVKRYSFYPNMPDFSEDITRGTFLGRSVIYNIGLQLAAYMGASEIYLLGVDHYMIGNSAQKGNHFIEDYITDEEAGKYQNSYLRTDEITKAYEKAEEYSKQHGFRIYNATRGGKLEVFERVNFDALFTDNR